MDRGVPKNTPHLNFVILEKEKGFVMNRRTMYVIITVANALVVIAAFYFSGMAWGIASLVMSLAAWGLTWLLTRVRGRSWGEMLRNGFRRIFPTTVQAPVAGNSTDRLLVQVAIIAVVGILLWMVITAANESTFASILIGIPSGFILGMLLISPLYALHSAKVMQEINDEPSRWKTARRPFIVFMFRTQNRFHQREKGTSPIDFVGLVQKGEETIRGEIDRGALTSENPKFWELMDIDDPRIRSKVGPYHRFCLVQLWVAYINLFVDAALVGIRDFYRIRWYPIEKTRYKKVTISTPTGEKATTFEIIPPAPPEAPEWSNHVRVAPFDWAVAISGAETKDRFAWNMLVVVNVECMNPWITLNNHESWSRFLTQAVTDAIVRTLRSLELKDVLELTSVTTDPANPVARLGDEARDKVIAGVYAIDNRLKDIIGLKLSMSATLTSTDYSGAVQILSAEPMFRTEADRNAFLEIWRAEQKAQAERILGDAEAYRESIVVSQVAKAVKDNGDAGMAVQRMQSLERVGANNLILSDTGSGSQTSNIEKLLALLVADRERSLNQPRDTTS